MLMWKIHFSFNGKVKNIFCGKTEKRKNVAFPFSTFRRIKNVEIYLVNVFSRGDRFFKAEGVIKSICYSGIVCT